MKREFLVLCILAALLLVGCSKTGPISSEDYQQAVNDDVQEDEPASTANVSGIEHTGISPLSESANKPSESEYVEKENQPALIEENTIPKPSMTINLNDYLKVSVSGIDGQGNVYTYLDKENFYLDQIEKIKFKNISAENTFYSLYTQYKNANATDAFFHFVSNGMPSEIHGLRNGDIATVKWRIDDEKIEKYFSLNYSYSDIEIKINGLSYYPETIDSINESIFDDMDNYCSAYLQKEANNDDRQGALIINQISREKCYYSLPQKHYGGTLVVLYKVNASVRYDQNGMALTQNSFYEDWTYYVGVKCLYPLCKADRTMEYSGMYISADDTVIKFCYFIDGGKCIEEPSPTDMVLKEEYYAAVSGYETIERAELCLALGYDGSSVEKIDF